MTTAAGRSRSKGDTVRLFVKREDGTFRPATRKEILKASHELSLRLLDELEAERESLRLAMDEGVRAW